MFEGRLYIYIYISWQSYIHPNDDSIVGCQQGLELAILGGCFDMNFIEYEYDH